MKYNILIVLTLLLISCASAVNNNVKNSDDNKCTQVKPWDNLSPFINRCIEIQGEVTQADYFSVKDYWIPLPELEKFKGLKVKVTGIVLTRKENEQQSERGVYYLQVKNIEPLK